MDNFNKIVFEKKYLRSLVSAFKYDYFLIMDFERLIKGNKDLSNVLSLNVYDAYLNLYNKNDWDANILENIYKLFMPFESKVVLPTQDYYDSLLKALNSDTTGYSVYKFLFKDNKYNLISSPIFSLLINRKLLKKNETPIVIQPFHYHKFHKEDMDENRFADFLNQIREDNEKYYLKRVTFTNEQIITKVNAIDKELLEFLKVIEIRVFGSYFNGTQNEYSDIDFLIVTDDKNCDLLLTSSLLGKSFTDLFGDNVDIHVIDHHKTLNKFDFMILLKSKSVREIR